MGVGRGVTDGGIYRGRAGADVAPGSAAHGCRGQGVGHAEARQVHDGPLRVSEGVNVFYGEVRG